MAAAEVGGSEVGGAEVGGAEVAAAGPSGAAVPVGTAEVYGPANPMGRLPLGVRQVVVQGTEDDPDLRDFGRRYARAAAMAGDRVTYVEMAGDHFDVIAPGSAIWRATVRAIDGALG
ncbi:hypothetical protein [Nonomuraea sp. SBT364]|uniref:hypothetical protein n=1 Tax=Nonomuraea sp. SBT364 TaxID=1580530 RepID=UPI0012E247DE|nr:hypothetical protein [Nonomuraea sp. SBT364]